MEKFHSGGVVNIRATGDAMQRLGLAAMAAKNTVRGLNAELDELDRKRRVRYRFALLKGRVATYYAREQDLLRAAHGRRPCRPSVTRVLACTRMPAATWELQNGVLGVNQLGLESDTGRCKVGNGLTPWRDLRYATCVLPKPNRWTHALAFWRWSDRAIAIATTLLLLAMLACIGGLFYNMHLGV